MVKDRFYDDFIRAIHEKRKIRLTFRSKKHEELQVRRCAPVDYGPGSRIKDRNDRYHVWVYDSDKEAHWLLILPAQVHNMEVMSEHFDPAEFMKPEWSAHIKRDWGIYS